jgi:hypothetical protein
MVRKFTDYLVSLNIKTKDICYDVFCHAYTGDPTGTFRETFLGWNGTVGQCPNRI